MELSSSDSVTACLQYMIHHVFLPSKLPDEDDYNAVHETALLLMVRQALQSFQTLVDVESDAAIATVLSTIRNMETVREDFSGAISEDKLKSVLQDRLSKDSIPLHIKAQNAGMVISRTKDRVCFEAFELSPQNEPVITTKGRLRRCFPGSAISVSKATFAEAGFQSTLSQMIAKMSHQIAPGMQPKVKKAGKMHDEDRDTTNPALVTELLTSFLRASGELTEVSTLWKNTREEVMWLNSRKPWRRSPLWLLLRVVLQQGFARLVRVGTGRKHLYKAFMLFLMSQILKLAWTRDTTTAFLFAMNAKLSRRLLKLDTNGTEIQEKDAWVAEVQKVMRKTHDILQRRWLEINHSCSPLLDVTNSGTPQNDVFHELPALEERIRSIKARTVNVKASDFTPSSVCPTYGTGDLPTELRTFKGADPSHNMAAFEAWVEAQLPAWTDRHINDATVCTQLGNSINSYYTYGIQVCGENPEALSVLILTILELWVACDKIACQVHGLLRDYLPEFHSPLLQSLILPSMPQMARLSNVEAYLVQRRQDAAAGRPSVFRNFGHPAAFSVKYFDSSPEEQKTLADIQARATADRQLKVAELAREKARYQDLMRQHDAAVCKTEFVIIDSYNGLAEDRHSPSCNKCRFKREAKNMTIDIHEWPLPERPNEAKSTVFELEIPVAFCAWRDLTAFVLDVLGQKNPEQSSPRATYDLRYHATLRIFSSDRPSSQRIGLLSETKPHSATHRRSVPVATASEAGVCLKDGLQYQYHDSVQNVFTRALVVTDNAAKSCTYQLSALTTSLESFLWRPPSSSSGLPPNEVLARQSSCPEHMSIEEFRAFATIPLGYRIQWHNVLVQLSMPSVNLAKVDTSLLLLQTMYQAGPAGPCPSLGETIRRPSHAILDDANFGHMLLIKLNAAFENIKENWEASQALSSFINLARRLQSLSSSSEIQLQCSAFLFGARRAALDLLKDLQQKVQQLRADPERSDMLQRTLEVGLVSINTLDIDDQHLQALLAAETPLSNLIYCSFVIRDLVRTSSKEDLLEPIMLERWKKLLYRAYPIMKEQILRGNAGLDYAIEQRWSGYQIGSTWTSAGFLNEQWLVCQMTTSENGFVKLHVNLLTAELLVNGLPLARLPNDFEEHPTYNMLFGLTTLQAVPTQCPGMSFSLEQDFAGYKVYMAMASCDWASDLDGSELLVHASKEEQFYDLLPSDIFRNILPVAFVENFAHWLNHANETVEFRPIATPWFSSNENWTLARTGPAWKLMRNGCALLSTSSPTYRWIELVFGSLELPLHIHTTINESSLQLNVELPRLQLTFFTEAHGSLQSHQFRGLLVAREQNLGTLVGLRSKLVLQETKGGNKRMVLIPQGQISYHRSLGHVEVTVVAGTASRVLSFQVDDRLGRLVDNGQLLSKLFLSYLHGLTAFCLPDALTHRTGTEQALSVLDSAAVRSFDMLEACDLELLQKIARMTPGRSYYPANERVMQSVTWDNNLDFISQHGQFAVSIRAILAKANDMKILYPSMSLEGVELDFFANDLLERDRICAASLRTAGYGAERHTLMNDVTYVSRDRGLNSKKSNQTLAAATALLQDRPVLSPQSLSGLKNWVWQVLQGCGPLNGTPKQLNPTSLQYDAIWFEDLPALLPDLWCSLHTLLSANRLQLNKHEVTAWLSTVAYSETAHMEIIHIWAALYTGQCHVDLNVPHAVIFELSEGVAPSASTLTSLCRSELRPFNLSPEAKIPQEHWETKKQAQQRRQNRFRVNSEAAMQALVSALQPQWPSTNLQVPTSNIGSYIKLDAVMVKVKAKFEEWNNNRQFSEYLDRVQDAMRQTLVPPPSLVPYAHSQSEPTNEERLAYISVESLFKTAPMVLSSKSAPQLNLRPRTRDETVKPRLRLASVLDKLNAMGAATIYEADYIKHLRSSLASLQKQRSTYTIDLSGCQLTGALQGYLVACRQYVIDLFSDICNHIQDVPRVAQAMAITIQQWPRVSPAFFLQQLNRARWSQLPLVWKKYVLRYGVAITELQRAERMCSLLGNRVGLVDELLNIGH